MESHADSNVLSRRVLLPGLRPARGWHAHASSASTCALLVRVSQTRDALCRGLKIQQVFVVCNEAGCYNEIPASKMRSMFRTRSVALTLRILTKLGQVSILHFVL